MTSESEKTRNVSRREFIKGAAAVTASVAAAGVLGTRGVYGAAPAPVPDKWDMEADVVIVGFGGAGAVTAMAAKDAGAEVLILEKQAQAKHTSNTQMCGGLCHQASDPIEAAKYFKAVAFGMGLPKGIGDPPSTYPHYPKELVEDIAKAWGEGVTKTMDFLKSIGPVEFTNVTMPGPAFPSFPGANKYGTFSVVGGGVALFKLLEKGVSDRKIKVVWETPGETLITNDKGEVIGVVARQGSKDINVKARRAVVLTAGGFEYDYELRSEFLPGWGWAFMGNPDNTGDGLRMAMGVGALLGHMYHTAARVVPGGPIVKEVGTGIMCRVSGKGMLLVDNYGERYINEEFTGKDPERYQFYNRAIVYDISKLEYPRIPSWFILDEKARKAGPLATLSYGAHAVGLYKWSQDNSEEIKRGWLIKADTIEELAKKIAANPDNNGRMDAKVLADTIAKFNKYSVEGKDPEQNRDPKTLGALETPPFYAMADYPGGPNKEGGPIRNAKSQVISVTGKPIARLYSGGELGSLFSFAYQGGGNIAECIIFGLIAGKNAAAEKPWGAAA
jgi:hypothetical protein